MSKIEITYSWTEYVLSLTPESRFGHAVAHVKNAVAQELGVADEYIYVE